MVSNLCLAQSQSVAKKEVAVVAFNENLRYRFNEGLCAVQRGQDWGFIDTLGNVAIDFRYKVSGPDVPVFKEGRCCVCIQTDGGTLEHRYIDKQGKPLFSNQTFNRITPFSNGLAVVEKVEASKPSYLLMIDSLGKSVAGGVTPGYSPGMKLDFRGFHDGLAAILDGHSKAWGFINSKGKWAILPDSKYQNVGDFHEGLAVVQESTEGKWGFINQKGDLIIPFIYSNRPTDFSEGLSAVMNTDEKVGYVDKLGNLVIPFRYEPINNQNGLSFFNGNTIVCREGHYYSITAAGKENQMVGDATSEIRMLQNGLIAFKKWTSAERWAIGLMRTNGQIVIEPNEMDQLGEFGNGLAPAEAVVNGIRYNGFVNLDANFVILNENH